MCFGSGYGYDGAGYVAPTGMGGIGTNFALIVVLFILLIIVLSAL
ncbi:MAG TPA: YjcZ family sporulation protein [Bacillus sp. (in: firmicutes)]